MDYASSAQREEALKVLQSGTTLPTDVIVELGLADGVISGSNRSVPNPDRCPVAPSETSEAYLLGEMSPEEARAFEGHYIQCASCAALVREKEVYVLAVKRATTRLRGATRGGGAA